ncbi:CrcB family protein [Haloferax mediterranei ATCC 33500]|uniref:Fluoride-specific ion channel FluC n=1 Tax=Haloferax mediterranei (strain ATCC 33500 / DSM 1411 / JCM 8866 / NBRC 14739 / NCIMB 2177 / R-4) TaxID=523841 RepID=I3R1F6_HALMT|nr:CrcB family protein [Haloferax mediterranei]AFK18066.1 CRCB integral membrane protein [Haloferax mediterranei ATCC 33500]AHZ22521.1 chromosome condensation protein CrcB [Haloferax mediterranei ATCC 33500]EMA02658.1 CRCB integral membrane protein [Haloferax mediterranei ATCC 33500]MDX5988159.1 CrcB family protein [Haloferax mediterranei ATCC 33500]QCQ74606.1 CrcB family protein [Haloferax mediterranei ATCC 33500]
MDRSELTLVAFGGFVGAILRYLVSVAVPGAGGTLTANVLGSFILGTFITSVSSRRVQLLFGTGMLSSFTTYSTFAVQTASLSMTGGLVNIGANYALGFVAAAAGIAVGRRR